MTLREFSIEFDVMYNNISSNQAPGLDEYEKSVFLTRAQNMLLKEYFSPLTDAQGGGFDGSRKRQYDFTPLIVAVAPPFYGTIKDDPKLAPYVLKEDSQIFEFSSPYRFLLPVNERAVDEDGKEYTVVPINYIEYQKLASKPYKYPLKGLIWRVFFSSQNSLITQSTYDGTPENFYIELIGNYKKTKIQIDSLGREHTVNTPLKYYIKYVKKPEPIILEDLASYGNNLIIDGRNKQQNTDMPEETHYEILERAVTLAKLAWGGTTAAQARQQQQQ
jgi:hypothetical protein